MEQLEYKNKKITIIYNNKKITKKLPKDGVIILKESELNNCEPASMSGGIEIDECDKYIKYDPYAPDPLREWNYKDSDGNIHYFDVLGNVVNDVDDRSKSLKNDEEQQDISGVSGDFYEDYLINLQNR